jgi:hypothetical protein
MAMTVVRERFVVDAKGRKIGVILSLMQYRKLLEDLHDLAVVAERREEQPIRLEALKRRLKKDGRVRRNDRTQRKGCS